jgi:hypothetical protein
LNSFSKTFLILGSILSIVLFLIETKGYFQIIYIRLLRDISFLLILIGFTTLFLQNQPRRDNNLEFYKKLILFTAITFILTQLNFLDYFASYIIVIFVKSFSNGITETTFLFYEITKFIISLIIIGLFVLFSNTLSKVAYQKYNSLILLGGILFYLLWIIFTYYAFSITDTNSPYFDHKPYWFLQWIANILFFIVFIRILFFTKEKL